MPERLSQAVGVVEPRHLLVTDLWVEPDHFGVLELIDEGQRVSDGGEKDVPARLVGLGLDGEPQLVAVVDDIPGEEVERLLVAVQSGADVLCGAGFGALAPSPEDDDLRTELSGEI